MAELNARFLTPADTDLASLAETLNAADWEASIKDFSEESLKAFVKRDDRFYVLGYVDGEVAGAVHGYVMLHPTGVKYLYVDEVDTMANHRRKGVAHLLMKEAFAWGREHGCYEAWLGTEHDNTGAIAFYKTLSPDETENGPIYTWKIGDKA